MRKYVLAVLLLTGIAGIVFRVNAEDLVDAEVLKKHFADKTGFKAWYNTLNQDDKNQVLAGAVALCEPDLAQTALKNGGDVNTLVYVARQQLHTHKYGDRYDHLIYTKGSMQEISKDAAHRPAGMHTMQKLDDHDVMGMPFMGSMSEKGSLLVGAIDECKGDKRKQLVQMLLESGVDVNVVSENGDNAFQVALKHKRWAENDKDEADAPEVFDLLMQYVPEGGLNPEISSALIMDAYAQKDNTLLVLYKKKKLQLSIKTQNAIDAFVDLPLLSARGLLGEPEDKENKAAYATDLMKSMLDSGMDVNVRNRQGKTALFNALGFAWHDNQMNEKAVRLLLDRGADVNVKDKHGRTALFVAVHNQDLPAVKLLLEHGADATVVDENGKSVLSAVDLNRSEPLDAEIYRLLISHGAKAELLNEDAETVLRMVDVFGSGEVLNVLLDNGLDANLHNDVGYTLLMKAVCVQPHSYTYGKDEIEDVAMVQTLLAHGADVNAQINNKADYGVGETALFKAVQCRHNKIEEILLQAGADKAIKNAKGKTAYDKAEPDFEDIPMFGASDALY